MYRDLSIGAAEIEITKNSLKTKPAGEAKPDTTTSPLPEQDEDIVRIQSAKAKFTNETILKEHIGQIKKAFTKFKSNH